MVETKENPITQTQVQLITLPHLPHPGRIYCVCLPCAECGAHNLSGTVPALPRERLTPDA